MDGRWAQEDALKAHLLSLMTENVKGTHGMAIPKEAPSVNNKYPAEEIRCVFDDI